MGSVWCQHHADVESVCVVVQTQLQSLGQTSWAVQMQSYDLTTPGSINATVKTDCHDKFGHWCLGELQPASDLTSCPALPRPALT